MYYSQKFSSEDMVRCFVTGWSNSRCQGSVVRTEEKGAIQCSFGEPIGKNKRKYETFIWGTDNFEPSKMRATFNNSFHFLTLFNAGESKEYIMEKNGYTKVAEELFMSLNPNTLPKQEPVSHVRTVDTLGDANWLNFQRGEDSIYFEQFQRDDITMYYIREDDNLASWARVIKVDAALVIDDVQTCPKYRRQGLSKKIMTQIIADSQCNENCEIIMLAASQLGQKLYKNIGFKSEMLMTVYSS